MDKDEDRRVAAIGIPIGAEDIERIAQALESKAITSCLYDGESHTLIDNVDPTEHLREDRVNENVSLVSSVPRVREILARLKEAGFQIH